MTQKYIQISSSLLLLPRSDTAEMESSPGRYTPEGPRCEITQFGGPRHGRCLDIQGERMEPGGQLQVYPCSHKWHQMFGFGHGNKNTTDNGDSSPVKGSIYGSVPMHILRTIQKKMHTSIDENQLLSKKYQHRDKPQQQAAHLCIGASGRGKTSYEPWEDDKHRIDLQAIDFVPTNIISQDDSTNRQGTTSRSIPSLDLWNDKYLVTVPCWDRDSVIEFLFVPFIEEDTENLGLKHTFKIDDEEDTEKQCIQNYENERVNSECVDV